MRPDTISYNKLLNSIYTPKDNFEEGILQGLKDTINKSINNASSLKQRQILSILHNTDNTPQTYIKAFSPLALISGSPAGAYAYKRKKLILHPSWAKHPSSILLAIHEFEHIKFFTDNIFPGDHYFKIAFYYFISPFSYKKYIEKKAILKTYQFIRAFFPRQKLQLMKTKLNCSTDRKNLDILRNNQILNLKNKVNPEKLFFSATEPALKAYQSWETSIYNKHYLNMLEKALNKSYPKYLKDELKKYKASLITVNEILAKIIFWFLFALVFNYII